MNKINYTSYYDCFEMLLDVLLKKQGINIKYLFKRPALFIKKNSYSAIPVLYSKVQGIGETLKEYNIIREKKYLDDFLTEFDFIQHIKSTCENGSCGTSLSTFSIPYSPHFHRLGNAGYNQIHMFEIEKIESDYVYIIDHYYQYSLTVSIQDYITMIKETVTQNSEHFVYSYYIKCNTLQVPTNCYNEIKNYYTDMYLDEDENKIYGFAALQKIIIYIENSKDEDFQNSNIETSYEISEMFKEVSDSHYQFGEHLLLYHYDELSNMFSKIGQMWLVLSNMFLKAYVANQYGVLQAKINLYLNSILLYHKDIMKFIEINIIKDGQHLGDNHEKI